MRGSFAGTTSFLATVPLSDKEQANPFWKHVLLGAAGDVSKPRKN